MDIEGEGCSGAVSPSTVPRIQLYREILQAHPFSPAQRAISSNPSFIQRLELQQKLKSHNGCVNACAFTPDGQHLLSGSDDRLIKIWNWQQGRELFSWHSGHYANVFQAKPMPNTIHSNSQSSSPSPTADLTVVSSAADGQIRIAHIFEDRVAHRRVGSHNGRVHKLALLPENPSRTFLSCGEDGKVIHYDLRLPVPATKLMTICHAFMKSRPLELYSVACNPIHSTEFCIGGQDEVVRVFDLRRISVADESGGGGAKGPRALPLAFISPHRIAKARTPFDAHVTAAVYSCKGEILVSYNDENIYLIAAGIASGLRGQQQQQHQQQQKENPFLDGAGGVVHFDSSSPSSAPHGRRGITRSAARGRRGNSREPNPPSTGNRGRDRGGRAQRRTGRGRGRGSGQGGNRHQQEEHRFQQLHQAEADSRWGLDQRAAAARRSNRAVELDSTILRMRFFTYSGSDSITTKDEDSSNAATIHSQKKADVDIVLDTPDSFLARLYAVRRGGNHINNDENLDIGDLLLDLNPTSSDEEGEGTDGGTGSRGGSGGGSGGGGGNDDLFSYVSSDLLDTDGIQNFVMTADEETSEENSDTDSDSEERQEESDEDDDMMENENNNDSRRDVLASRWPLPQLTNWNTADGFSQLLNTLEGFSVNRQGGVVQMYQGHRNEETIKGVSFFGLNDEWVISGSDCGYIYFWSTKTGEAIACLHGDSHVVNCIERHPYDIFTLATSGIDDDVKIWGCSAVERVDGLSVKDKKRMERNINQRQMSMRPYDYGRHYIPNGTIMGYSESESEEEEDWNF